MDAKSLGLPQSRNRIYLITFHDEDGFDKFGWPKAIEAMELAEVLDPTAPNDDHTCLPVRRWARQHVQEAKQNLDPAKPGAGWLVDEGVSRKWTGRRPTQ